MAKTCEHKYKDTEFDLDIGFARCKCGHKFSEAEADERMIAAIQNSTVGYPAWYKFSDKGYDLIAPGMIDIGMKQ